MNPNNVLRLSGRTFRSQKAWPEAASLNVLSQPDLALKREARKRRWRTDPGSRQLLAFTALLAQCLLAACARADVTFTTLYSFRGPDGANPVGLLQGNDGNFYGTTSANDIANTNYGTVFRITPDGAFTNLHVFSGADDGAWPQAGLAQDADGNFYGTTYRRGANGWGTVFKITPSGDFTTLVSFDSFPGDANSFLVQGNDGNFYTMGNHGGTSNLGTLFTVAPDGAVTVLVSFDGVGGFTGWFSNPLLQGADGNFYGATQLGGPAFTGIFMNAGYGTLFTMTPDGTLNNLFSFNGTNGYAPIALVQGADGNLYGTTGQGGPGFRGSPSGGSGGYGTVFKLTTNGVFTTLALFDSTNGLSPISLMLAGDGNFYGTTDQGGTNGGYGTIFKITTNGALTSLFSFNGTNGASPRYGPLLQAADGGFYGTTYLCGASNLGTVFHLTFNPAPPAFENVTQSGGAVNFTWDALPGRSYQVQFKTSLSQTNWSHLGDPVTATNTTASVFDAIGPDRQRFYRIQLLP